MIDRQTFRWPDGQQGAVSLTYDDALPCHLEVVAPQLEAAGLRATFNVGANRSFRDNWPSWRDLAARGHELGNHSLFHPCRRDTAERQSWLHKAYDLRDYTERRWLDEMRAASFILSLIDGRAERTFANTCCENRLGRGDEERSLEPLIAQLFVAARGECVARAVEITNVNYNSLGHFEADGRTAEEHRRLAAWLGGNRDRVWTAPMIDVARHLRRFEKASNTSTGA
jgi:sialate O-acetylesterase